MRTRPRPVTAIITTLGERRELLRQAIGSVLDQRTSTGTPWPVEVLVVFDAATAPSPEELGFAEANLPHGSTLRCIVNTRTAGLAGGRNTGILAAANAVVGFLDDDDCWLPGKLAAQQGVRERYPSAVAVGGGMQLRTVSATVSKQVAEQVLMTDLLNSRVHELHPSSLTFKRADLLGRIGLVDEALPYGYGEDYDLVLRASRRGRIHNVADPVVCVGWDRESYFDGHWARISAGLTYLLRKFPEFEASPQGLARIAGQVSFAHAASGNTSSALAYARSALRRDPGQLRAWAALVVAARLIPAATLVRWVQKTGHGL